MKNKLTVTLIFVIIVISIGLSLGLGMMDYETQSLHHLLTSDRGNLIMLSIFTIFFSSTGIALLFIIKALVKSFRDKN